MGFTLIIGGNMSDRLQELAEQSGLAFIAPHGLEPTVSKFANLIVYEIINIMKNCDGDLDYAIYATKQMFPEE